MLPKPSTEGPRIQGVKGSSVYPAGVWPKVLVIHLNPRILDPLNPNAILKSILPRDDEARNPSEWISLRPEWT